MRLHTISIALKILITLENFLFQQSEFNQFIRKMSFKQQVALLKINKSWKTSDVVFLPYSISFICVHIHPCHNLQDAHKIFVKRNSTGATTCLNYLNVTMKDPEVGHCFVTPNLTTNQLAQLIQYQLDLSSRTEVNSGMSLRFHVAG